LPGNDMDPSSVENLATAHRRHSAEKHGRILRTLNSLSIGEP